MAWLMADPHSSKTRKEQAFSPRPFRASQGSILIQVKGSPLGPITETLGLVRESQPHPHTTRLDSRMGTAPQKKKELF